MYERDTAPNPERLLEWSGVRSLILTRLMSHSPCKIFKGSLFETCIPQNKETSEEAARVHNHPVRNE